MTQQAQAVTTFTDAVAAKNWQAVVNLAKGGGQLEILSDVTNIGLGTLERLGAGSIQPSKNQRQNIFRAVKTLTA